ncbi:hypothetical protein PVAP13_7KG022000 [Panicum virgatum]|uniref:Secreted protein n=1 Tax=Panicum virgatum TaxID=38727 RepID=A0A8T0Q7F0_PANVG|nr:hypothetical protein PVAP13_7KG022000 [Panicum virgatum]
MPPCRGRLSSGRLFLFVFLGKLRFPSVFTSSDAPNLLGLPLPASLGASASRFWIPCVVEQHHLSGWTNQFDETGFKGGSRRPLRA